MEMTYKSTFLKVILGLFILNALGIQGQLPQKSLSNNSITLDSFKIAHQQLAIDGFDAIYIVSPKNELLKLNAQHEVEFKYSNFRLGDISSIDVSNPLTTICFHKDFQTIALLDRTLSPLSEIDLADWGFSNVTAVCSAGNSNIWIYDASDMQLIQIAKDRTTPIRTFPINLDIDEPFIITKMLVNQENIYCLSAKGNLYKISLIGESLQKILGAEQLVDFQFSSNRLLIQDRLGHIYHYKSPLDFKQLPLKLAQKKKWIIHNGLYIYGNGKLIWRQPLK